MCASRWTRYAVGLLLAALLGTTFPVAESHAEDEAIVDEDYRFELKRPDARWRLLDHREIVNVVPDAVAGATRLPGYWGAVVVEAAPGAEVETFARFLLEQMSLEHKEIATFEKTRFQGEEAVRFRVTGRMHGVRLVFRNVVFLHEGHAYQVLSWAPEFDAEPSVLAEFSRAFSLLPGPVQGRSPRREQEGVRGVGWRIEEGTFQSAPYGLAVRPRGPWRLVVGSELRDMNTDAVVGLTRPTPEAYLCIIAERATGVDRDALVRQVRDRQWLEQGATPAGPAISASIAGEKVEIRRYRLQAGVPQLVHAGAFFRGDLCFQVIAWHAEGVAAALEGSLEEAFASIELLEDEAARRLRAEMLASPHRQESVGQGYAFRGGIYRSFEYAFTWEVPAGWWRVSAGQAARQENPDATLIFEAPAEGLQGVVVAESAYGLTAEEYHDAVLGNLFDATQAGPDEAPDPVPLGQATGLYSSVASVPEMPGVDIGYAVLTVVHKGRAVQMLISGLAGNLAASPETVRAARDGLRVQRQLRPTTLEDGTLYDWRLGMALTPPGRGWKHQDVTPGVFRSLSSMHVWSRPGREVFLMGVCGMREGHDLAWAERMMADRVQRQFGTSDASSAEAATAEIDGRPATRRAWRLGSKKYVLYVVRRGPTFFCLALEQRAQDPPEIEAALRRGFRLLD